MQRRMYLLDQIETLQRELENVEKQLHMVQRENEQQRASTIADMEQLQSACRQLDVRFIF